jgi:hypothetical protein
MLPRSLSREAQEGLHDRAGEPFVALHRRAEPRQCATIQRFAFFKEMTYLTARASLGSSASASPSHSRRSSIELKSKLLIISAGLWVPITELWTGTLTIKPVIGVASCDLPSTSSTPFAVMFTTSRALVSFSRRFRPPRYRAALIHLSASSRLSDRRPITCRGSFPLR